MRPGDGGAGGEVRTTGGVGDLCGISALSDPEACRLALRNKKSEKRRRRSNIIYIYISDNETDTALNAMGTGGAKWGWEI